MSQISRDHQVEQENNTVLVIIHTKNRTMEMQTRDSKEQHDSEEQTGEQTVRIEVAIIRTALIRINTSRINHINIISKKYNQEGNQGAPTSTDATLLRTSSDIHNKPQETTAANNQRSNYDHTRTPNRGRGRRFFGRGLRNSYPVRKSRRK